MKISKASLIILIIGILIIVACCLGWIYLQKLDQQKQLESNLEGAKKNLALIKYDDLNSQKDLLSQQIEELNNRLAATQDRLKSQEDSINATDAILEDAKSHGIDILNMRSQGKSKDSLSGIDFDALSIEVDFAGNIHDISNFAISLNEKFPTSIESLVQIDKSEPTPTPTPTDTPTPAPTPSPTPTPTTLITPVPPGFTPIVPPEKDYMGKLNLVIYNYKGN
jgi:hypothetical protein